MAYVEDYARSWTPRRQAKSIERSVDRAVAEVAAANASRSAAWAELVSEAQAAVATLPAEHFAMLAAKHGITAAEAEAQLMRLALSQPALVVKAVANTLAKIAEQARG